MRKHDSSKGERHSMPTYDKLEWNGLEISGQPAGLQSIPVLGLWLKRLHLYTGSRRPFSIHVRAKDVERRKNTVTLSWFSYEAGMRTDVTPEPQSLQNTVKVRAQPERMMSSGEDAVRLRRLALDTGEEWTGAADLVTYDVQSFDALMDKVMFLGIALIATTVIAILSAFFGAWAGSNLFRDDDPIPVMIVEPEAPTPQVIGSDPAKPP